MLSFLKLGVAFWSSTLLANIEGVSMYLLGVTFDLSHALAWQKPPNCQFMSLRTQVELRPYSDWRRGCQCVKGCSTHTGSKMSRVCWRGGVELAFFVDFWWSVKISLSGWCCCGCVLTQSIEYIICTLLPHPCSRHDQMCMVGDHGCLSCGHLCSSSHLVKVLQIRVKRMHL